jgi:hypothetical protein
MYFCVCGIGTTLGRREIRGTTGMNSAYCRTHRVNHFGNRGIGCISSQDHTQLVQPTPGSGSGCGLNCAAYLVLYSS